MLGSYGIRQCRDGVQRVIRLGDYGLGRFETRAILIRRFVHE
jgi:hypothetical protein